MCKSKKVPIRMCIGCRERKPKEDLVRIVKNAKGEISIDKKGKADGRGAYICLSSNCFNIVRKKRGLERSFRCKIDDKVYSCLEKELEEFEWYSV